MRARPTLLLCVASARTLFDSAQRVGCSAKRTTKRPIEAKRQPIALSTSTATCRSASASAVDYLLFLASRVSLTSIGFRLRAVSCHSRLTVNLSYVGCDISSSVVARLSTWLCGEPTFRSQSCKAQARQYVQTSKMSRSMSGNAPQSVRMHERLHA